MNIDDGRILPQGTLDALVRVGNEDASRWVPITEDERRTLVRRSRRRRSACLSKMRGHLPPERA